MVAAGTLAEGGAGEVNKSRRLMKLNLEYAREHLEEGAHDEEHAAELPEEGGPPPGVAREGRGGVGAHPPTNSTS